MDELGSVLGDAVMFVFLADDEAGDVLKEDERHLAHGAQRDEVGAFLRTFGKENPVVGQNAHRIAHDPGEAADEGRPIELLELLKPAAVDDPGDDFLDVEGLAKIRGHNAVQFRRVVERILGRRLIEFEAAGRIEGLDDVAGDLQRMRVVVRVVVRDSGDAAMDVRAAEVLVRDLLARGRLDQGRAADEDRPLAAHDHGFVAHGRNIRASGRARSHDDGDLGDAEGREAGLVVEDPPEMLLVGERPRLMGKKDSAGIDEIDAGQPVFEGHFLGPDVLFDGGREIRPALDRGIVGNDENLAAVDDADAGHHARTRRLVVVKAPGGQRAQFQEGRIRIEKLFQPLSDKHLAA